MGRLEPDARLGLQRREKRLGNRGMSTYPNHEKSTEHDLHHYQNHFETRSTFSAFILRLLPT